jgi:hypothetical protein
MGVDHRLGECGVEAAQNMQNLEESILAARAEVDFVGVIRRGSGIRIVGGSADDSVSDGESLVGRKISGRASFAQRRVPGKW